MLDPMAVEEAALSGRASGVLGGATVARCAVAVLLGLSLANCAGSPPSKRASSKDYGVKASPRVVAEGDPVPKGGGREMTGKPYVVDGRTYAPHAGRGYDREGWASWYGSAFHGRLTANGEIFDRQSIAAAHPTLPLPSYVRVTNLGNGRSMIVRVNDRGPYEYGRLIDLSEAAADALAFKRRGTSRVRVQYVGRAAVAGSDDQKLLATLTTNGTPAFIGGGSPPPVMVAARPGRDDEKVRSPLSTAAIVPPPKRPETAEGSRQLSQLAKLEPAVASGPPRPASKPAPRADRVVDATPAPLQRPVLTGIY